MEVIVDVCQYSQYWQYIFLFSVEVEGYGPYKPVPPPKPVAGNSNSSSSITPSSISNQQPVAISGTYVSSGSFTPPPYRMPPYPLYGEQPAIPGSAATPTQISTGLDGQAPTAASTPHGLHTHSSKFPVSLHQFNINFIFSKILM